MIVLLTIMMTFLPFSQTSGSKGAVLCRLVQEKCLSKTACRNAMHEYIFRCSTESSFSSNYCPNSCKNALIGILSAEGGEDFFNCECQEKECLEMRNKTKSCEWEVMNLLKPNSRLPCELANWICEIDQTCSRAMAFYNDFCKAMIAGRKCTSRCKNSLNILNRLRQASKLKTCYCNYNAEYGQECLNRRKNMDNLCLNITLPDWRYFNYTTVDDNNNQTDNDTKPNTDSATNIHPAKQTIFFIFIAQAINMLINRPLTTR